MTHSRYADLTAKRQPMTPTRAWKAMVRAVAAFLLLATFVTPALAEIGCAEESIAHLQDDVISPSSDQHEMTSSDAQRDDNQKVADHCAFSHGHCAGLTAAAASNYEVPAAMAAYASSPAAAVPMRRLTVPERPPAA